MKKISMMFRIVLFVLCIGHFSFAQHATFTALGYLPGGEFNSSAQCVSADGTIVAGKATIDSRKTAFVWSRTTGMTALGNLPDGSLRQSLVTDISADGSVIVGWGNQTSQLYDEAGQRGFIWTAATGMQYICHPDSACTAQGVSADGSVVVGAMGGQAFRWSQQEGLEMLGMLDGCNYSTATAISDDGEIITGSCSRVLYQDEVTYIWTRDKGMQNLGYLPGHVNSFPNTLSPNGLVIAGSSYDIYKRENAYSWTAESGMNKIDHLPGRNLTHPSALSGNGNIIIGDCFKDESGVFTETAFIWDKDHGTRDLQNVLLSEYELDIPGWSLSSALGISHNGNVIVGSGENPSGKSEAFLLVLDTTLVINYFGQTPPAKTAEIFAPGILSLQDRWETKVVFSPDGSSAFLTTSDGMYYTQYENRTWTQPVTAPFATTENDGNPAFSLDGNRLYFSRFSSDFTQGDIWMAEKTPDGWNNPEKLGNVINSTSLEQGYSETADGSVFVDSKRAGGQGNWDIWRVMINADSNLQAENMGAAVNSAGDDAEPCIAPDGSYLVFSSGRDGNIGEMDLYVSFKNDQNKWTTPVNLEQYGQGINIPNGFTMKPSISPDGKFLFFHLHDTSYSFGDIYWVSTSIIKDAKNDILTNTIDTKSEMLPNGFRLYQNYPNPFNPSTVIPYSLHRPSNTTITVYNTRGQKVKTLVDLFHPVGEYMVSWNGTDALNHPVASGIYIYRIEANNSYAQRKMMLVH